MRRRLLVFTKPPVAGRVKTRLIGDLSAAQAARLHAAMVEDLVASMKGSDFEVTIAWALEEGEKAPVDWPERGLESLVQAGADLGARLFAALSDAVGPDDRVAAIGTDHPGLDGARIEEAFAALGKSDLAIGPTLDGGYYLIAVRGPTVHRSLFQGIPWSTAEVCRRTLDAARELGLSVTLLPEESDVDSPEDLQRLRAAIAASRLHSPRVEACLASFAEERAAG